MNKVRTESAEPHAARKDHDLKREKEFRDTYARNIAATLPRSSLATILTANRLPSCVQNEPGQCTASCQRVTRGSLTSIRRLLQSDTPLHFSTHEHRAEPDVKDSEAGYYEMKLGITLCSVTCLQDTLERLRHLLLTKNLACYLHS